MSYADQLVGDDSGGGAPGGIEFEFRIDLLGAADADVFHLTTMSAVVGDRRTPPPERIRRARRFAKAVARRRIPLVRTIYGDEATPGRAPSRVAAILDQVTTSYIVMSSSTPAPRGRATVIAHSHLRDRFLGYPRAELVPGRLLIVAPGSLPASYEAPLKVFPIADLPGCTLRVVGTVPPLLVSSFARTASRHPATVSLCDATLSDAARVLEITQAEVVIVTSPNSHEALSTMMLALSLDRPVLVEETATTRSLADEVGKDWVLLHEGRLTAATLEKAMHGLKVDPPSGRPDLSARESNAIARQYAAAYRAAASSRPL